MYYIYEEDGEPLLSRAEGCTINWKPGKNTTVKASSVSGQYRSHLDSKGCIACIQRILAKDFLLYDIHCWVVLLSLCRAATA